MPVDWSLLPEQFQYLRNGVIERHAMELGMATFDKKLGRHVGLDERLTPAELLEIAPIYDEIIRREDNLAILEWRAGADRNIGWYIWGFLMVLHQLGSRGIEPFGRQIILLELPEPPLNWNPLPANLAYVAEAVAKYEDLWNEMAIVEWLDEASEEQLAELAIVAERMLRDYDDINAWCEAHKESHKREEFKVSWMYCIFDHADLLP